MITSIKNISKAEQKIALSSIETLSKTEERVISNKQNEVTFAVRETGEIISIPLSALKLLKSIISNMAEGKSITLMPTDAEISTQQAAEILKVSRPHLIKLLENGTIPFKKVGSHRRILLKDVLKFKSAFQKQRRKQLDNLSEEAQKLNLGY